MVSIVIPTYNEKANIESLFLRIRKALKNRGPFEVVVIDDYSDDGTWEELEKLKTTFPLRFFKKQGMIGKAYSLVEGFEKARGEILVMIDADLQYPPEAIPQMLKALEGVDVVVANRKNYHHSILRKAASRIFRFAFGKFLFGLDSDIQSGLKAFRREIYQTVKFAPRSQWTFDLEFLNRAKEAGFKMVNLDITFHPRKNGHSKIELLKTAFEIGFNALSLRLRRIHPQHIPPAGEESMLGAGVGFRRRKYITHTTLAHHKSAIRGLTLWQKTVIGLSVLVLMSGFYFVPLKTAIILVAILSTIYFVDVLFNLFLILKSLKNPPEISLDQREIEKIDEKSLPVYSILCPLYREAAVLPQFVEAISQLDWPKDKLDVILLLEEDDKETQEAASQINLPLYVRTLVVPHTLPKTKPKACNFGLIHAKGEYLVIFDAEDRPEPEQLKKAYLAFKKVPKDVICLQAKLNYYNPHQNLLTKLFTAEYSLWFDVTLTGLQSINTTIPLGGTSNHFRTRDLLALEGWDPFNVTEDADLGVRLFKAGYKTAMIDSTTYEEANSRVGNWLRQRSRWIKGYMQTYLVHMRDPIGFIKTNGLHAFIFQLVVGGKIAFMFINPFLWIATISYFALYSLVGPTIEALYPPAIFYMAAVSLVFGNFMFMYYYMIGCAKRGHWPVVKYVFLVPVYWLMISAGATIALYQLVFKPHFWEKTVHGFHLGKEEEKRLRETLKSQAQIVQEGRISKIRALASSGMATGGILIAASVIANFFNFLYNAYLGRRISVEEFGLVSLVGSFLYLSSIPIGALGKTVSHRSAYLLGRYETSTKQFWSHIRKRAILISLAFTALWLAASPALATFFNAKSLEPFIIFAPAWFIGLASTVDSGFLTGNLKFKVLALLIISGAALKFFFSLFFVELGYDRFVYAAIPASMAIAFLIGWVFARSIKETQTKTVDRNVLLKFPKRFYLTSILTKVSSVAYLSFDIILAKHFLSPKEAGEYALLSLIGKMIFFVGSLFSQFINPVVSREEGAQRSSRAVFYKLLFLTAISAFGAYLAVGVFSFWTTPILFGEKVQPIIHLLPIYGFGIFCFSVAASFVTFYQVRQKHLLAFVSFLIALAQIIGIVLYHQDLNQIVNVMNTVGMASLAVMLSLHFVYKPFTAVARNISDMLGLFSVQIDKSPASSGRLRILIFNWRDMKHIWSGGSELYIHEIAKELVNKGNKVTIFCGNDGNSQRYEIVDGVEILRHGGFYTVYVWAFLYYIFKLRKHCDIIIDNENGVPFFTSFYARKPIIGLVHHVHQEVFRKHLAFPFAQFARFLEAKAMPYFYKNIKMVTVSKSSKEGMEALGLGRRQPIEIINPGVDLAKFKPAAKSQIPLILYLGRLKPYKSIETAIYAMEKLIKNVPNATLTIAGDGESRADLEKLVKALGLERIVTFLGKVSERTKSQLFAKSWVMVQPSSMEGWGITTIEANASGTPVIAANVPGLRDSIKNPHSGILVPWGDASKFARKIEEVLTDKSLRRYLEEGSREWAKNFSWKKSATIFEQILERERNHFKTKSVNTSPAERN